MQEIAVRLYQHACKEKDKWHWEKKEMREFMPIGKELRMRLDGIRNDLGDTDGGLSPHIKHLNHTVAIIEKLENERKGTDDEVHFNMHQKFKFALLYMKMLERPHLFKHLDKFIDTAKRSRKQPNKDTEESKFAKHEKGAPLRIFVGRDDKRDFLDL